MAMRSAILRKRKHGATAVVPGSQSNPIVVDCESPNETSEADDYRRYKVKAWASGKIRDIDLCTDAWYATRAGAKGLEAFAVDPESIGRNHSRKIRTALGIDADAVLYWVHDVPCWDSSKQCRV